MEVSDVMAATGFLSTKGVYKLPFHVISWDLFFFFSTWTVVVFH